MGYFAVLFFCLKHCSAVTTVGKMCIMNALLSLLTKSTTHLKFQKLWQIQLWLKNTPCLDSQTSFKWLSPNAVIFDIFFVGYVFSHLSIQFLFFIFFLPDLLWDSKTLLTRKLRRAALGFRSPAPARACLSFGQEETSSWSSCFLFFSSFSKCKCDPIAWKSSALRCRPLSL